MALGKHNVRVKALSEKIAQSLGNALVAPVDRLRARGGINPPKAHMRFPGTITVPDATFEKVLEYAARSFRLHGFRDIVFLGDHGGYQKSLKAVADRLDREWAATPVRVHAIDEYYRVTETRIRAGAQAPRLSRRGDRHACRARRHVAHAGDRSAPRAHRPLASGDARAAPTASMAIRGGRAPSWDKLGVDADRHGDGRGDPAAMRGIERRRAVDSQTHHRRIRAFERVRDHAGPPIPPSMHSLSRALARSGCASPAGRSRGRPRRRRHRRAARVATVPGHATRGRSDQSLQRNRRRQVEPGGRRPTAARLCAEPQSNDVYVIDPATFKVVDKFKVGINPQHVVPSWDLHTLWVANNAETRSAAA